jgi:dihydrofolate reductase
VVICRIRYQVACSLDGYIADADGGTDWIVGAPEIDSDGRFDQFDMLLMGHLTYEKVLVFSRTLRRDDHPAVTIVSGQIH